MMDSSSLLDRVARYRRDGWRLAVINATAVLAAGDDPSAPGDGYDVSWSFARGAELEHLRERLEPGEAVPSIASAYPAAFLYENELRELFGIEVTGLEVDLHGELYRTAARVPFSVKAIRARLEARKEQS
jgi:ech hydrogenase subunit D